MNIWPIIAFALEQNFAFWTLFFTLIHFRWIHPAIALAALLVAVLAFLSGSRASQIMIVVYGLLGFILFKMGLHELLYFTLGLSPLLMLSAHMLFRSPFVLARSRLSFPRALLFTVLLYPASFWALHEPGFPIPAMLTPSGIIYLPFLPIQYILLTNESLMTSMLRYLNW